MYEMCFAMSHHTETCTAAELRLFMSFMSLKLLGNNDRGGETSAAASETEWCASCFVALSDRALRRFVMLSMFYESNLNSLSETILRLSSSGSKSIFRKM